MPPQHLIKAALTWIQERAEGCTAIYTGIMQTVRDEMVSDKTCTATLLCLPVVVEQFEDVDRIEQRHGRDGRL